MFAQTLFSGSSIGNKLIVLLPAPINAGVVELVVEESYGPVNITISAYNCTELPPPPTSCNTQVPDLQRVYHVPRD
jgi:hypothetical protein